MKPNINVTPLIDVLLVLLIIFMVIAPAKPTAFKAKVPAEPIRGADPPPSTNALIVAVKNDSSLRLNREDDMGTVEESERLIETLRTVFRQREQEGIFRPGTNEIEKTVFIKAPKNINYGSVAKVVDAVKLSGAEPIGLQLDDLP
ncbi:MAG TPA: biopolymer transporter ExbD [Pyrinomonadaceae bacterium]|jgi:biopolymer transport protein ExbD